MTNSYKLDQSFGPTGSITGIILFVAGVILVWFSWYALTLKEGCRIKCCKRSD